MRVFPHWGFPFVKSFRFVIIGRIDLPSMAFSVRMCDYHNSNGFVFAKSIILGLVHKLFTEIIGEGWLGSDGCL